jgi:hypothetical protein
VCAPLDRVRGTGRSTTRRMWARDGGFRLGRVRCRGGDEADQRARCVSGSRQGRARAGRLRPRWAGLGGRRKEGRVRGLAQREKQQAERAARARRREGKGKANFIFLILFFKFNFQMFF